MTRMLALSLAAVALLAAPPSEAVERPAAGTVVVERRPATVETHVIDPDVVPEDVSEMLARHDAVTWRDYRRHLHLWHDAVRHEVGDDGRHRVLVRMTEMHVRLGLEIDVYLPADAADWLADHERAHARVHREFYESADERAAWAARRIVGRHFRGEGDTLAAAKADAREVAFKLFYDLYDLALIDRVDAVQAAFDAITRHGARREVDHDAGVRLAYLAGAVSPEQRAWQRERGVEPLVPLTATVTLGHPTTRPAG